MAFTAAPAPWTHRPAPRRRFYDSAPHPPHSTQSNDQPPAFFRSIITAPSDVTRPNSYIIAFISRLVPRRPTQRTASSLASSHLSPTVMKSPGPTPAPFGDYFVDHFNRLFPHFATYLRPDQAALAANAYLFRFDSRLSTDFVRNNIDAFSRSIADASGKSVAESRRLFTTSARDAARSYFADGWQDVSRYVNSNAPALLALQQQNDRHDEIRTFMSSADPMHEVDAVQLKVLMESQLPVVVYVFANYCSFCKEVGPRFERAARQAADDDVQFVSLNGPLHPEAIALLKVNAYPSIVRLADGKPAEHYPIDSNHKQTITEENIIAFAHSRDFTNDSRTFSRSDEDGRDGTTEDNTPSTPGTPSGGKWRTMLMNQGIDELDNLAAERDAVMLSKIDRAIHCGGSGTLLNSNGSAASCPLLAPRECKEVTTAGDGSGLSFSSPPPMCVLVGGGMGAGKTTVVNWVSDTAFWKAYGDSVVVVEADAFKMSDPVFLMLQGVTPFASRIVHRYSIEAAEKLLLEAVNSRRDVVFDGTLSWSEYARQTIAMLRDTEYLYERGPGCENGKEQYWVRSRRREVKAKAYRVELVGVTAEADISVMRGIVRRITTGRGVTVPEQLKSHALFSQHFEEYVGLVDAAYLFDTTLQQCASAGGMLEEGRRNYADKLIALREGVLFRMPEEEEGKVGNGGAGGDFVVRVADAYERFLKKQWLNVEATKADELFVEEAVRRQR